MKKLNIIVIIGFLFVSNTLSGQGLRGMAFGYFEYTQPPADPVLTEYDSYKVVSRYEVDAWKADIISDAIEIKGFEKKPRDGAADFIVEVQYYPLKFGKRELMNKEKSYNDDGVKKTKRYYYYTVKAEYQYKLRIYVNKNEVLFTDEVSGSKVLKSDEFESSNPAYKDMNEEKEEAKSQLMAQKLRGFNAQLNEKFGSVKKNTQIRSANIKPKRNNSYDDYNSYLAEMKKGFEILNNNEKAIGETKPHFDKAIHGFKEMLKESDLDKRKARVNEKVTSLLYANIGHMYFMMRKYDKAIDHYEQGSQYKSWVAGMSDMIILAKKQYSRAEVSGTLTDADRL